MNGPWSDIIRRHAQRMEPIPTSEVPRIRKLDGLRAVMFDIYGTLLISASGDLEASANEEKGHAMVAALAEIGIGCRGGELAARMLVDRIREVNEESRQRGIDHPEVDIVTVWGDLVPRLMEQGVVDRAPIDPAASPRGLSRTELQRLALEYEMRVNPVGLMPHAQECLKTLFDLGLHLGIISNAQYFSVKILETLLQADAGGFDFDPNLQYCSYQHGRAKPGLTLYRLAAKNLEDRNIQRSEVLYVGNDMLKDIMPAAAIGFRTALFAGDARSFRPRQHDPRVEGVAPDLLITDLMEVPKCIG